jgi:anti-sigma factor RsiW
MMATLEQDLEQLEQYLDGALDAAAVSQLQNRLTADNQLAATLTELRAQRTLRSAFWQNIDPDPASADRLVWRIKGATRDLQRTVASPSKFTWNSWRIASFSSAAAACVILGFMFGRVGRNSPAVPAPTGISTIATGSQLVQNPISSQSSGSAQLVSNNKPKISVPITDEYGRVVAWQTFDNPEDAKNFTEDLHKTRIQPSAPAVSAQPRLVDQEQQF